MRKERLTIILLCIVGGVSAAQRQSTPSRTRYNSRDGAVVAIVTSTKAPEATPESRVELRTISGKLIGRADYSSEDGEHGYGITKASWTPDSQFFVYSLESSGGHQAWHSPVRFFSRRHSKFLSLDDALNDAVMNPQFTVHAPDKVTVELYFSKKVRTVSLSALHASR